MSGEPAVAITARRDPKPDRATRSTTSPWFRASRPGSRTVKEMDDIDTYFLDCTDPTGVPVSFAAAVEAVFEEGGGAENFTVRLTPGSSRRDTPSVR